MSDWTMVTSAVILLVWFFWMGASIGSFLNVVVWRMPRGISIAGARSNCPHCGFKIPFYDNIPIFGWLHLRGRCRGCDGPISPRYPLVETLVAVTFSSLAAVEVVGQGWNLPQLPPETVRMFYWLTRFPDWRLFAVCAYHCAIAFFVVGFALIDFDGHHVPRRLWSLALLAGLLPPLFAPFLLPVSAGAFVTSWVSLPPGGESFVTALLGAAMGALLGFLPECVINRTRPRLEDDRRNDYTSAVLLSTTSAYLGWQAALSIALCGSLICLAVRAIPKIGLTRSVTLPAAYAGCVLFQILFWRSLLQVPGWPGPSIGVGLAALYIVLAILAGTIAGTLIERRAPQLADSEAVGDATSDDGKQD